MIAVRNIVVATDFGPAAASALAYGRDLARLFGARLHVVTVVESLANRALLTSTYTPDLELAQRALEADAEERLKRVLAEDDRARVVVTLKRITAISPASGIIDYATHEVADLILVGTHGRRGLSRALLGSVAERVVREAPCPVLVIRTPEHEFLLPDALETVKPATTDLATT